MFFLLSHIFHKPLQEHNLDYKSQVSKCYLEWYGRKNMLSAEVED